MLVDVFDRMAAEIGTTLLEKVDEQAKLVDDLEAKLVQEQDRFLLHQEQRGKLNKELTRLREAKNEVDADLAQIKKDYAVLKSQVEEDRYDATHVTILFIFISSLDVHGVQLAMLVMNDAVVFCLCLFVFVFCLCLLLVFCWCLLFVLCVFACLCLFCLCVRCLFVLVFFFFVCLSLSSLVG